MGQNEEGAAREQETPILPTLPTPPSYPPFPPPPSSPTLLAPFALSLLPSYSHPHFSSISLYLHSQKQPDPWLRRGTHLYPMTHPSLLPSPAVAAAAAAIAPASGPPPLPIPPPATSSSLPRSAPGPARQDETCYPALPLPSCPACPASPPKTRETRLLGIQRRLALRPYRRQHLPAPHLLAWDPGTPANPQRHTSTPAIGQKI